MNAGVYKPSQVITIFLTHSLFLYPWLVNQTTIKSYSLNIFQYLQYAMKSQDYRDRIHVSSLCHRQ